MKKFKEFIDEGLLSAMKPKPMEDVRKAIKKFDKLDIFDRIIKYRNNNIPEEFMPSEEEILKEMGLSRINKNMSYSRVENMSSASIENFSSRIGTVSADYNTIVRLFGEPCIDEYGKSHFQWIIKSTDGKQYNIYDYNIYGSKDDILSGSYDWNIGGISEGFNRGNIKNLVYFIYKNK